jgi:hypothetical protein
MSVPTPHAGDPPERDRRGTYLAVILTEVAVLVALWMLGRSFS